MIDPLAAVAAISVMTTVVVALFAFYGSAMPQSAAVRGRLQGLMAGWGYAVPSTGAFDAATEAALVKFKQDNGLAATYRLADGSSAYHPFIDAATKAKMVQKLGG